MTNVPVLDPISAQSQISGSIYNAMGILTYPQWAGIPNGGMFPPPLDKYADYVQQAWADKMNAPDSVLILFNAFPEICKYDRNLFKQFLCNLAYQDKVHPGARTLTQILFTDGPPPPTADVYDPNQLAVSGGIASPFVAMSHYLFGKGETLTVALPALGITVKPQDVTLNGVNLLDAFIYDSSFVGTKPILVDKFAYDTAQSSFISGTYIGNMSLKLQGNFTRYSDGNWQLTGVLRAYDDTFDFNPSDHRSPVREALTYIGANFDGTPFQITFPGEIPVSWNQNDKQ